MDESWTTKEAASKLKDIELNYAKWGHLHQEKQLLDGMAAMNILQRYLTYYNSWSPLLVQAFYAFLLKICF